MTPSTENPMMSSKSRPMTSSNGKFMTLSHDNLAVSSNRNIVTSLKGIQMTSSQGQLMMSPITVCPLCKSRNPGDDCRDGFCASVWDRGNSMRGLHI